MISPTQAPSPTHKSNLTRAEAVLRGELLTVASYAIDLDLTVGDREFRSVTIVRFACALPGASTFVDVQPRELRRARLNGRELDLALLANGRLPLTGLAEENELVVEAVMAYSHDGEGLHRHVDPADGKVYLYATSALAAAPRWFACFDQPDLKASLSLSVSCPPTWTVVANGAATTTEPGRWVCAVTPPMSTYIATIVAGDYYTVTSAHEDIPLALHVRSSLAAQLDRDADELFALTGRCLDEFHRLFGIRYMWGEYHQAFVPEFNWGAMENPGCVTFRDDMIFRSRATDAERASRASTIAHEMAHMWFGNLVTMRWWDDLWLNESFAEYLGHRVCDVVTDFQSWIDFGIVRKSWGYRADCRPSTHPIASNGAVDVAHALNDFDGISYAKGACVLRQLATHLGDQVFFSGLGRHFAAHSFGNAEFADLIGAWTAAGAMGLTQWAEHWLQTAGMDTISARHTDDGIELWRSTPVEAPANRPHTITVSSYDWRGRELSRTPVTVSDERAATPTIPPSAVLVLPDAADQSWAKIALTAQDWRAVPNLIPHVPAAARVVFCNSLRLGVADAEIDPAFAVEVLSALLPSETNEAIIASMSRWATDTLVGTCLAASARRSASVRIADAARRLLAEAAPSSGRQLAAARAYVAATADAAALRRWLAGQLPDGLDLDADLRWAVLRQLITLGQASTSEVEAERDRDNSAQGAVQAARCRALLPDPLAKQTAWARLMTDSDCSNYELYAIAEGFWHPDQDELTTPYVERYFAEINGTARLRSGMVVSKLATAAYPWTAVAQSTVAATRALLANPDLDPQIRRAVTDVGDDLRRAVACRATFGADTVAP